MESAASPPPLPNAMNYRYSKPGLVLALIVIAACAVFVVRVQTTERDEPTSEVRPNRMLELLARYTVGTKALIQSTGQPTAELNDAMLRDVGTISRTDEDALRILMLKGWLADQPPDEAKMAALAQKNEGLKADVEVLGRLSSIQDLAADEAWKLFCKRHGWMAQLARAQTLEAKDPARQAVVQQGMGTAMVLIAGMMLGMLAAVGGLVLMIWGIRRWRGGKLRLTLGRRSRGHGGVLIEGFAIYLLLFLLLPWLLRLLPVKLPGWAGYVPALGALILGMLWPLMRGMQRPLWRETLGLHRGQGLFKEMGAGVLGWLAALPLLVLGMIAASWITKLTGQFPSHPIVEVFAGNGWAKLGAVVLAVVWAPVSEELMFRGLLFPGLSAWLRWLLGMLLAAFVFAVIHPQGWAGVPAIMALAATFSFLRMWRQSLIAPMTAHALNNGIMCAMMLLLW
ncbi:MAG: CPBP family glutamic-type intramembrane protease [Prosthecobacter sp.]|nr:CPBP family glutamic-type intramembrane protease [Prosthecobacter sp.]